MLTAQPNRIQVFDLEQQELLWQIESQNNPKGDSQWDTSTPSWGEHLETEYISMNIQGVQGLSDAEQKRLQMVVERKTQEAIALQNHHPPEPSAIYSPQASTDEISRSISQP